MEEVLVCTVTINFPNCEHSQISKRIEYESKEEYAQGIIERQNGKCGKCYAKECDERGIIQWYLK